MSKLIKGAGVVLLLGVVHLCAVAQNDLPPGPFVVDSLIFQGNEKTEDYILHKEMNLNVGDTVLKSDLREVITHNENRLLNTGLFNEADIQLYAVEGNTQKTTFLIDVSESWYIYPIPILELADRNFNVWWDDYDHSLDRLNLGLRLFWSNVTGQNDRLKAVAQFGFTQEFQLNYDRPFIGAFTDWGVSVNALYATNKDVAVRTLDNKSVFVRDEDKILLRRIKGGMSTKWSPNPYLSMETGLDFNQWEAKNGFHESNPDYMDGRQTFRFLTLNHSWTWDHRDRSIYPRKGLLLRGTIKKWGLGAWNHLNRWAISGAAQYFHELSPEWSVGGGVQSSTFLDDEPLSYRLNQGLGYGENYVRGYERLVVDGTTFAYFKTEAKYTLTEFAVELGPWFPLESMSKIPLTFYLSGGIEGGVSNAINPHPSNDLVGDLLLGTGISVDVLVYNNYLFSVDLSTTKHGYGGIFIHTGIKFD